MVANEAPIRIAPDMGCGQICRMAASLMVCGSSVDGAVCKVYADDCQRTAEA